MWTDSDRFAGTERHCLDLAVGLSGLGVDVSLGCRPDTPLFRKAGEEGVHLVELDAHLGPLKAAARVGRLLKSRAADIVHVHNGKCAVLARMAIARAKRGALVATQHFIDPARTRRRGLLRRASNQVHRWVDKGVARWISISGAVRDAMVLRGDSRPEKISLVLNGVRPGVVSELDRHAARQLLSLPVDRQVLVCPARLEPEKGHFVLLNALKMLGREGVDFLALCVGEGSAEGAIRERIQAMGLEDRVWLVGQQPEIGVWLRSADAVVLPSPAEPFGLALVEAMCRRVPVVAAAAGGPSEILEDEAGLLFKPNDARDLGEKLLALLTRVGLRESLAESGFRRWAERFTIEKMSSGVLEAYHEVLSSKAV